MWWPSGSVLCCKILAAAFYCSVKWHANFPSWCNSANACLSYVVQPCPAPAFRKITEWPTVEAGRLSQAFYLYLGTVACKVVSVVVQLYLPKEISFVSTLWFSLFDSSTRLNSWSLFPWTLRTFIELKSLGFFCVFWLNSYLFHIPM